MKFAQLVSSQKRAILTLIALLCGCGVWAAWRMPTAIFPQTDFPRIVVSIDAGEMPAAQMLASITRPVEEAMNGIPGVVSLRSDTSRGSAQVDVFFDWGVDIAQSLQMVNARLSQLRSDLPPEARIETERLTFAVFPVLGYSLTSSTRDLASLRDLATLAFVPRLSRLSGVARVAVLGGKVREWHVVVDPSRLMDTGLGITDVADAIRASNVVVSPGLVEANHQLNLVLVSGQVFRQSDIESLVVGTSEAAAGEAPRPILLSDVAKVARGVSPDYVIVTADGKPAVLLNVVRQPDANTRSVADEIKAELRSMREELPPDVRVAPFYDQSLLVRASIASVRDAILIGLVLSVAIIYCFLGSWSTTLIASAVIPITVLLTFAVMPLFGLGFDLMTLGAVAAAIGLVIDNAIIVVENIDAHLGRGARRIEAVASAVHEITVPLIGSTLTPVVVFLPLCLLSGVTGVFFKALAITMVVALLASLALALTFTPALAEQFVREPDSKSSGHPGGEGRLLRPLGAAYARLLRWTLAHRLFMFAGIILIAVLGGALYNSLGTGFLPEFDEGAFVLDYIAPPGTSLAETDRILRRVEAILKSTPEVESYSRRTGAQLGLSITEPNTGDFLVKLKQARQRSTEAVTGEIRSRIAAELPEDLLQVEFAGILNDLIGDLVSSPAPIEIKLFSTDTAALFRKADEVESVIRDLPGIVDTYNGIVVSGPAFTLKLDPRRAALLGMSTTEAADAASASISGEVASSILEQGHLVDVRVLFPAAARSSLEAIRALPLRSAKTGGWFRLDQIADVKYEAGQTELHRDNLRQAVAVTARIETSKTDLGSAIRQIQEALRAKVVLPPGMSVEYGGLYHEQQESFLGLLVSLVLAVLLVFLVLLVEFQSFAHPVAIVGGSVLALPGVLAGLVLTGQTFNVISFVGAIMVVGIVAKNGILILDTVGEHLAAGETLEESLVVSGRRRLRPVLMTSFATILGMLPLALGLGEGSELLQPLAIAVIGGLMGALLLSLVLTPALYALFGRRVRPAAPSS